MPWRCDGPRPPSAAPGDLACALAARPRLPELVRRAPRTSAHHRRPPARDGLAPRPPSERSWSKGRRLARRGRQVEGRWSRSTRYAGSSSTPTDACERITADREIQLASLPRLVIAANPRRLACEPLAEIIA